MIQPGERFDVEGKTFEAVKSDGFCKGYIYDDREREYCMAPNRPIDDCFNLRLLEYVIFKEVENEIGN